MSEYAERDSAFINDFLRETALNENEDIIIRRNALLIYVIGVDEERIKNIEKVLQVSKIAGCGAIVQQNRNRKNAIKYNNSNDLQKKRRKKSARNEKKVKSHRSQ